MDGGAAFACCGDSGHACVFAKALLARSVQCELVQRQTQGERELLACSSPVARTNCGTLAALLHERARFALKLPPGTRPLMHLQALRLQCGGLLALQAVLEESDTDVHRLVMRAQECHGSLTALPWPALVGHLAVWQPRRRSAPPAPAS